MATPTRPMPKVWSELKQSGPSTDCVYSATLMVLVGSGFDRFPMGMYTDAERNALESSNAIPDGSGGNFNATDLGVRTLYGVSMKQLADGSRNGLRRALSTPGRAYAVAGLNANLSIHLRRWDDDFEGNHAVCCIPLGGGHVLWLDPLATMAFPGERVSVETVLDWAFIPSDARFLDMAEGSSADALEEDTMGLRGHKHQIPKLVRIPIGTVLRTAPRADAPIHRQVAGSDAVVDSFEAEVLATGIWPFLLARRRGGNGGFYVSARDLPRTSWLGTALYPDEIANLIRGLEPADDLGVLVGDLEARINAGIAPPEPEP